MAWTAARWVLGFMLCPQVKVFFCDGFIFYSLERLDVV